MQFCGRVLITLDTKLRFRKSKRVVGSSKTIYLGFITNTPELAERFELGNLSIVFKNKEQTNKEVIFGKAGTKKGNFFNSLFPCTLYLSVRQCFRIVRVFYFSHT